MTGWQTPTVTTPDLKILSGTLQLRDPRGGSCPRTAEAAISIRTSTPGLVSFDLTCTGDRAWSRSVTAHRTGPNRHIAVAVLSFEIERKEQVNCALKVTAPQAKVLALSGRSYTCVGRETGGSTTIPVPPVLPPPVIVDPPRLVCAGGRVTTAGRNSARATCQCSGRHTPKQTGPNSYRCEPIAPVGIACVGGTKMGTKCVCAPSMKAVPTGANAWRCTPRGGLTGSPAGSRGHGTVRGPGRFYHGVINRFPQGRRTSPR